MPTGLDANGWVGAPADLAGAGQQQWESMIGRDRSRAMVGGDTFGPDGTGMGPSTGFQRITTGSDGPGPPLPGHAHHTIGDWRDLLDWQHSPTIWVLAFALAAVGLIHARVNLKAGPAHFNTGVG